MNWQPAAMLALILSLPMAHAGSLPQQAAQVARSAPSEAAARQLLNEGESYFAQRNMNLALDRYQRALALDPTLYEAALWSGDVFLTREDYRKAREWYQKAININPERETAYRYWATTLLRENKLAEAGEYYVDALIRDPGSRYANAAFERWLEASHLQISPVALAFPFTLDTKEDGSVFARWSIDSFLNTNVNDPELLLWPVYIAVKMQWRKEKFRQAFPREASYRLTLKEESEALRALADAATHRISDQDLVNTYGLPADSISRVCQFNRVTGSRS